MQIQIFNKLELKIRTIRNQVLRKLNKRNSSLNYDAVISIGEACFCADALRKCKLREQSFPFDWISNITFSQRIELLKNEFKDFLNIEDLEFLSSRDNPKPMDLYKNTKNDIVFSHDFAYKTPLNESFPKTAKKFERRIKRLLQILNADKKILFVYIESSLEEKTKVQDENELIKGIEELNKKFKAQINLVYIKHDSTMKDGEYHHLEIAPNATKITLNNKERLEDGIITGNFENVKLFLQNISLN